MILYVHLFYNDLKNYLQENPSTSDGKPRIWTSPFLRTQQTTAGVVHGAQGYLDDCDIRETPFLMEQSFGIFSHLHNRDDQAVKMPMEAEFHRKGLGREKFTTAKPQGESPFDTYKNVTHFLDTVYRDVPKNIQDIVAVSHGVTTRLIAMRVKHLSIRALDHFPNPGNGDVMVLNRKESGIGFDLHKVFDGEKGEAVNIDLGAMLLAKAPKLSAQNLPPVPEHLKMTL